MTSTIFTNIRVLAAEQLKESISEPAPNTKIYLTFGRVHPWSDENSPDAPTASVAAANEIWRNMVGGKRIIGSDVSHVIPRFNWVSGTTYAHYDDQSTNLYNGTTQFYVLTSDWNVYKCLSNSNNAISTVEPRAINPENITSTSDGYIWKYMYTISDSEQLRYVTSSFIPVKSIDFDDGSLQWDVQDAAVDGAIYYIKVTDGGIGYSNVSNLVISITGDGSSASATGNINVTSGQVSSISMLDNGQDYSHATVTISGGGGSGATARAIISPKGGHGSNPLYELGASYLLFNPQLKNSENNKFPPSNDIRQIALIKDPISRATNNVAANLVFSQSYALTTIGTGDYQNDEMVYQGPNLAGSSFSGRVFSWDSSNGVVYLINTEGTPTSQSLVGSNTSTSRFVSSIIEKEMIPYSGQILYVNNFSPITRSSDQTEDFKIILRF